MLIASDRLFWASIKEKSTGTDFFNWNARRYATRWGVEVGETRVLVQACPIMGRKFAYTQSGRVTLEKQWTPVAQTFALQATVADLVVKDVQDNQFLTLAQVAPSSSSSSSSSHF